MDRMSLRLLQVAAAALSYLVLSLTVTSALEISIFRQVLSGSNTVATGEKVSMDLDTSRLAEKKFEFVHDPADSRWERVQVKTELIGKDPDYPVQKIFLFKCKDTAPLDCVDYEPVQAESFLSGEKGTFFWDDVSRNRKANFLTLVKFKHDGNDFWIGYWDEAARNGVESFSHTSYEMSGLSFYAKPGIEPAWVRDFIQSYYMLPGNWMDRTVMGMVDGKQITEQYQIVADKTQIEVPVFDKYRPAASTIDKVTKDYMLAFAKGSVSNPVTFFFNPLPNCGDGACDISENPDSCCQDCGCSSASQTCTSTAGYPNGLCHVCGDGTIDPVENSTNCCSDAGCPADLYCSSAMNIPYGKCVTANCGNAACEPSENSGNCPVDCWKTPGKTCADFYGTGYYFNEQLQTCMLPECGSRGCETGEDASSCCKDCGCATGMYCNTEKPGPGTCMSPNCGNGRCEPAEDYTNCCTDCSGCPADPFTGQLQVCTQNMCHLCGNGNIELPVETPKTCCQDTGCTEGYCSVSGACKDEADMGVSVKILPETVDCTQTGEVDIRITFVNGPSFFSEFESISYTYQNSRYKLSECIQQGDIFMCKLPLTGPDTFQGCFEPGPKSVVFSVLYTYFEDAAAKKSNVVKYKEATAPLAFDVGKARLRACNKNGACEPGLGETPDYCCWDCMCEGGLICTPSGCRNESVITLAVNPEDLPASNNIDCNPRSGVQATGEFTFKSHVQNVPESAYETFDVLNWKLKYGGRIFTAQNIPGFSCDAVVAEQGRHTGDVQCSVPVSMFPACPNPPPADIELTLNILGGGLGAHYAPYEGKPVSAPFALDYVQGLPLCGNGEPNPELGETSDNCCRDMGCPGSKVCTVYTGCVDESQVDLRVTIDPQSVDCSREPQDKRGDKKVVLLAEVTNKPYSPATGGVEFGDAYIEDSRIEEMGGICEPVVNSTMYSVYGWRCTIPVADFNPFCWRAGAYTVNFENNIAWQNKYGNRITKRIVKPVTFSVGIPRERQCVPDGFQDPELGEIIDQCCPDAGCSGDNVCTKDVTCVANDQISIVIEDVAPDSLDCSAKDDPDNKVTVTARILNLPYETQFIEWLMRYGQNTYTEQYFTCTPVTIGGQETSTYRCEMPVHFFPACATAGNHQLTLQARITHSDFRGHVFQKEVAKLFTVNVGTAGLPNCKNGVCDKSLGETTGNCCQDCGCPAKDGICTEEGACYREGDLKLTVEPVSLTTKCQLAPWDMDTYKILTYQCVFQDQVKLKAHFNHKPYLANVMSTSYVWDGKDAYSDSMTAGEPIADGWKLYLIPNPDGSYRVSNFAGDRHQSQHTISRITMTMQLPAASGEFEKIARVVSTSDVRLTVNEIKNEDLLDLEKALQDAKDAMDRARTIVCSVVALLAICTVCSLMAGGVLDKASDNVGKDAVKNAGKDKIMETGTNEWASKYGSMNPDSQAYKDLLNKNGGTVDAWQNKLGEQKIYTDAKNNFLKDAQPPMSNQNMKTTVPIGIFSTLMQSTSTLGATGSGIVGGIAGLAFMWIMADMLECEDSFMIAVGTATVVCGIMMFAMPQALKSLAKVCDMLALALQMLMMITDIQNLVMEHQACVVQAESSLSARPSKGNTETGVERSKRITDYYRQLAACHKGLESNVASNMQKWQDFSNNLAASTGRYNTMVQANPSFGTSVGPAQQISITHNFPKGSGAQMTATFNYQWRGVTGNIGGTTVAKGFSLQQGYGSMQCSVVDLGLRCNYNNQLAVLEAQACEVIARSQASSGRSNVDPADICKGAKLTGTISFSWLPCDTNCGGDYYFESTNTASPLTAPGAGAGSGGASQTQVTVGACCRYASSGKCENALNVAKEQVKCTDGGGTFTNGEVCSDNACVTPAQYCSNAGTPIATGGICLQKLPNPAGIQGDLKCCDRNNYYPDWKAYCNKVVLGTTGEWCDDGETCALDKAALLNGKPAGFGVTAKMAFPEGASYPDGPWRCCSEPCSRLGQEFLKKAPTRVDAELRDGYLVVSWQHEGLGNGGYSYEVLVNNKEMTTGTDPQDPSIYKGTFTNSPARIMVSSLTFPGTTTYYYVAVRAKVGTSTGDTSVQDSVQVPQVERPSTVTLTAVRYIESSRMVKVTWDRIAPPLYQDPRTQYQYYIFYEISDQPGQEGSILNDKTVPNNQPYADLSTTFYDIILNANLPDDMDDKYIYVKVAAVANGIAGQASNVMSARIPKKVTTPTPPSGTPPRPPLA